MIEDDVRHQDKKANQNNQPGSMQDFRNECLIYILEVF